MFTGIIQAVGRVRQVLGSPTGKRIVIDASDWRHQPAEGDSIAINGVCLTYAPQPGRAGRLAFDAVPETLERSTLGALKAGDRVNLEPSLTASAAVGGHFVQGHVDGIGRIAAIDTSAGQWRLTVEAPVELMPALVPKGSVALDGISLTIASVDPAPGSNRLDVAIIPTTLRLTTLGEAAVGQTVNIETDIIARTVVHVLKQMNAPGGLTMDKLRDAGFL